MYTKGRTVYERMLYCIWDLFLFTVGQSLVYGEGILYTVNMITVSRFGKNFIPYTVEAFTVYRF